MLNKNKSQNEALIKTLVSKEGFTDLGWANDGVEFNRTDAERTQPIREVDCSLYANRGTHKVYVDYDHKEILRVDMSD